MHPKVMSVSIEWCPDYSRCDCSTKKPDARLWSAELPPVDNARAYFFTVVRNLVLEHARCARIVPMERLGEVESLRIITDEPGPDRKVGARQELERLCRILDELSPRCRRTFELRKFDGLSIRETANRMGPCGGVSEVESCPARLCLRNLSDGLGHASLFPRHACSLRAVRRGLARRT
jgi:hypothetical protein